MKIKQGLAALLVAGSFMGLAGSRAVAQMPSLSASDRQFLTSNGEDSIYELESAEVALQQAQSPVTLQTAVRIINDHTQFQIDSLRLARQYGVKLPVQLNSQDTAKLNQLQSLKGSAFDRAYLQQLASTNGTSVSDFQKELNMTKNSDVQNFVINYLPLQGDHTLLANLALNKVKM